MNIAAGSEQIRLAREPDFTVGAIEVRPSTREAFAAGQREVIEPRVMQVLVALSRRRGDVVSREDLTAACWAGRVVGDDAINRCIARVRKLGEAYGAFVIETVPRVGYRLVEAAAAVENGEGVAPPPVETLSAATSWFARHRFLITAAAALAFAVMGITFWTFERSRAVVEVKPPTAKLIAVLPFTPLYAGGEAQRLGDSIAAAVSDTLSRIGQHVVPPADSFQFRGNAKAKAARALNAAIIVDGEVRRAQEGFIVSVRVQDSLDGATVLARTFRAPQSDAEALPDRVAAFIAAASWGVDFTDPELRATEAMKVYELEQSGEFFAAYQTARAMAMKLPGNAVAQLNYAVEAVNLFIAGPSTRQASLVAEARAAEEKAIRLRPDFADIYGPLASTTPEYLWAEREVYLRKGLALLPGSFGLSGYLLWLLNDSGRFHEAEPYANSLYEQFPYEFYSFSRPADRLLGLGRADAAKAIIAHARRLWPDDPAFVAQQFEATAFNGDLGGAEALLGDRATAKILSPAVLKTRRDIVRALRTGSAGDLDALAQDCATPGEEWWSCMLAFAKSGQLDSAFRIAGAMYPDQRGATRAEVERKWIAASIPYARYLFVPAAAAMRSDPRLRDIVDRIGLLPYWRTSRHAPDFCASEHAPVCALLQ